MYVCYVPCRQQFCTRSSSLETIRMYCPACSPRQAASLIEMQSTSSARHRPLCLRNIDFHICLWGNQQELRTSARFRRVERGIGGREGKGKASSEEEKEMVRNARENIPGIFLAAGNFRAAGTHGQFLAKMAGNPCMLADKRITERQRT